MLKVAVIGVGSMGINHVRVYREMEKDVELVAVADQDPQTASVAGKRYAVPHYTNYIQVLDECKPDLVSLCVPTGLHYAIGAELIKRGVHLLVEKPIAATVEDGLKLIELAEEHKVTFAVGHIERFNPAVSELRRRLAGGMAGRILKITTQRLSPYPSRIRDAGVVIDLASHDIDLVRYLVGEDIIRLYGETHRTINSDREDLFNGTLRFKGGAIANIDVNWVTPTKVRHLNTIGTRGMFRCDLLSQELFFYENETAPSQWDTLSVLRGVTEGNILGIRINRHEPLAAEISDFVSAVRDGKAPNVTAQDGLETLRLASEFLRSAATNTVVKYSEVISEADLVLAK
jgi:predicted dehydrogenase